MAHPEGHKLISSGPNSLENAVRTEGKYQYWWDAAAKTWAVKPNIRNVFVMASGNATFNHSVLQHNEWMTPGAKDLGSHSTIGHEAAQQQPEGQHKQNADLQRTPIGTNRGRERL